MIPPAHGRLRTTRRALWHALAIVLVLMALAAVAASRLLPMVERNPDGVAAWLSERAGHPVGFERLETGWTRRGPLLRLDGLRIGEGEGAVTVGAAEILVSQYAGLLPGRSLTELRLRNIALTLERDGGGRWQVRGLPGQGVDDGDPLEALERLGELQVVGGSVTVLAPDLDLAATVPRVDLRMRVNGSRVRAAARAWMRAGEAPVRVVARFDRDSGDGRVYAGLRDADLDGWAPLLRHGGVEVDDGHGLAEVWAELRDFRIDGLAARLDLEEVGVSAQPGAQDAAPVRVELRSLQAELQWRALADGWRIDAPRLHLDDGDGVRRTDNLAVAFGSRYALVADRLEASPVLALLALGDRASPQLRDWLRQAQPHALLEDVELAGERGGAMRARARIASLGFASVGDAPGLDGVRGDLVGDADGAVFAFDSGSPIRFDWPSGFGAPHEVALQGEVAAWAGGDGWEVRTPALRVDGDGYGADVRGGLRFQNDGGRPWIDLAARVDEARVPVAKRFWVRHLMPDGALEWLDAALVDGLVRNGRAVVSGDLDDWPFEAVAGSAAPGLFRAEAEVVDATLRFQPDWPAAESVSGQVRFIADGFDFRGSAAIAGIRAEAVEARIPDFGRATLDVSARAGTDAGRLLAMLRQSPLALDYLQGLEAEGQVSGSFGMRLPMHGQGQGPRIEGALSLEGVRADETEWGLAFRDMRGELRYDEAGFSAAALRVRHENRSGALSLRAGDGHVSEAGHVFEGDLRVGLGVAELLARVPELDWLRPHVRGHSSWSIAVAVPSRGEGAAAAPGVLQLRSDLVGTRLDLPAPLDKGQATALPTRIQIPLPLGEGDIQVRMGQRMAVRARAGGAGPAAVRVHLGGGEAAAPPARGIAIGGSTPVLAAMEWAGLAAGRDGDDAEAPVLQDVDLQIGRLVLAGGGFQDVRVRAGSGDDGTRLRFDGEALSGQLTLAAGSGGEVSGHFERLHWRGVAQPARPASPAADPALPLQVPGDEGADPADIPPIRLSVEDLRLQQAQLGSATLATRQAPDGMRIERLEAQSQKHHIVASGDWSGRGAGERTRVDVRVASGDFGELLAGLGHEGRIRGGDGRLEFAAAWPGSPGRFRADALEGTMKLSVRDGQLVELEPGAGRVLGLLSLAELPRRLALDFRDFFDRGFAFNHIGGDMRVVSGQARSDNLVIEGPAAEIRIAGSADLRAQTYDQTIDVLPRSGNLLTAVGAIAGGPVGAAVGAMANAVLRRPLSELGATTYRVTGPWKEPKVEVIRREPPRVAERELQAPSGGAH